MTTDELDKQIQELELEDRLRKRNLWFFQRPGWWQALATMSLAIFVAFLPHYFDSRFETQDTKITELHQENVSLQESQSARLGHAIEVLMNFNGSVAMNAPGTEIAFHGLAPGLAPIDDGFHLGIDLSMGIQHQSKNAEQAKVLRKEAIAALEFLPDLRKLTIDWYKAPAGVFDEIPFLPKLRVLVIHDVTLTDAHLESLVKLQSLEVLDIHNTRVTDGCTASLLQFPKLRELRVDGTQLTDEALVSLGGLKSLTFLRVPATCSKDAIDRLRALLPKCYIRRGQQVDRRA